ncbi:hypothetical protein GOP47_0006829 [Adiantum capillus-veneris]|uniref:Histone deacetylase interacting domain-containing protein n=1 Tax=Adiantum capillus-veneris TaxID=13818 RepID=A0A9D4V4M4_ADICA|nr:hypothetical protein GOP47_0006829 [Adiantum capillus-veneris]
MKRAQDKKGVQVQSRLGRPQTTRPISLGTTNAAISFVQSVAQASRGDKGLYHEFDGALRAYKAGSITISETVAKMVAIFFGHPDLLLGFNAFLPKGYNSIIKSVAKELDFSQAYSFVQRIKVQDEALFKTLMDIVINHYRGNTSTTEDFRNKVADLWKNHSALVEEFVCFFPEDLFNSLNPNENARERRTYMDTPISKLDLSQCNKCSPSYRRLPPNYPFPSVASRTPLARAVLNDKWVLGRISEDSYYGNPRPTNKYEKAIQKCDDDRYELDMLIETATYTLEGLERLSDAIQKQGEVIVDDYLTAIQLRHIERIYGEHGLEALDSLHGDPRSTVPILLVRVRQKSDEWLALKETSIRLWADAVAKNYEKSRIIPKK